MRKTLLFLAATVQLAWAAGQWTERKNLEADPARPLGWRFEVPTDWRQVALANFPYPLGESWEGPEGAVQVCWVGNSVTLGQEQLNLEARGYVRSDRRIAGRDAAVYEKKNDLFCYVATPKGKCRLHLTGASQLNGHILQSFTLMEAASAPPAQEVRYEQWAFTLPSGWAFQSPDLLTVNQEPVARLSGHTLAREVMLRGWARSEAAQSNSKLKERLAMEPWTSKPGCDGYLVEWKGPGGSVLFAYTAQQGRGLRMELLRSSELERLRRLLSSVQFRPQ